MSVQETDELILRQLVRETLMHEYFYKWGSSSEIERKTASGSGRSKGTSGGGNIFNTTADKIANTDIGKKIKATTRSLTSKIISNPLPWLMRTLRRTPGRLTKLGFVGGLGALAIPSILDYFKEGGKDESLAFDAQHECQEKIDTNRLAISGTTFMKRWADFNAGLSGKDFNSIDPSKLDSDLTQLLSESNIDGRILALSSILTSENLSIPSGIADTTLRLEEPKDFSDNEIDERAKKLVLDSAVCDIYVALTNEISSLTDTIEESIKEVTDADKKSKLSDIFRKYDRSVSTELNLSMYPELSDLLTEG